MREIKFRAFDTREGLKRMFYNVSFMPYGEGWNNGNPEYKFYELFFGDGGFSKVTAKDTEIMQYVGLKDKNGKEIYEGDLLKFYDRIVAEVVFESFGGWSFKWIDETYKRVRSQNPEPIFRNINLFEVVGNIYEHQTLLK